MCQPLRGGFGKISRLWLSCSSAARHPRGPRDGEMAGGAQPGPWGHLHALSLVPKHHRGSSLAPPRFGTIFRPHFYPNPSTAPGLGAEPRRSPQEHPPGGFPQKPTPPSCPRFPSPYFWPPQSLQFLCAPPPEEANFPQKKGKPPASPPDPPGDTGIPPGGGGLTPKGPLLELGGLPPSTPFPAEGAGCPQTTPNPSTPCTHPPSAASSGPQKSSPLPSRAGEISPTLSPPCPGCGFRFGVVTPKSSFGVPGEPPPAGPSPVPAAPVPRSSFMGPGEEARLQNLHQGEVAASTAPPQPGQPPPPPLALGFWGTPWAPPESPRLLRWPGDPLPPGVP